MASSSKRIVNCAITGSIHSPTMSQYLPYKTEDIAQNAIDAASAGATAVHIHARNPENGMPSSDLEIYDKIISKIRQANKDVIICVTTGGGAGMSVDDRLAVVPRFKPQLCSMNAGSFNWGLYALAGKFKEWKFPWEQPMYSMTKDYIFKNTFADMERMLTVMAENGTKPELECYDIGHLYNLKTLQTQGLLKGKPYLQFVLGVNGALGADTLDLVNMKTTADRLFGVGGYEWSAFGAGRQEYPICTTNLFLGGHVRVGMEDNLNLSKGVPAKSNAELVEKMVRIMKEFDYEPASPAEGKEMLGL
jgi:uncharacterized protein (DUF849 family)